MTYYYYLASNENMTSDWHGSLDLTRSDIELPSFDVPIQIEVYNGVEKEWELRELMQYIHHHMEPYKYCTVQVAHLLNTHRSDFKIHKKSQLLLHQLKKPNQLLLEVGHLLTIKKSSF